MMELFFKVHTIKMHLPRSISVFFPAKTALKSISPYTLPLALLLKASGADRLCIGNRCQSLNVEAEVEPVKAAQGQFFIAGDSHPELRNEVAEELNKTPYSFEKLLTQGVTDKTVYLVAPPSMPTNETILKTIAQVYELSHERKAFVHLVASYLPYARSDKSQGEFGVAVQGRLVAQLLEAVGMGAITAVRPHAPQSMGFFKVANFVIHSRKTINKYLTTLSSPIELVVSPDAGFQKDATEFAIDLGLPVAIMNKKREISGKSSLVGGAGAEDIAGKAAVVIDDETASGGTLAEVCQYLKEKGATRIVGVVTHLAGSAKKLLNVKGDFVDEMVVTNTLPIPQNIKSGITVLSIAPELAEHIKELENFDPQASAKK